MYAIIFPKNMNVLGVLCIEIQKSKFAQDNP